MNRKLHNQALNRVIEDEHAAVEFADYVGRFAFKTTVSGGLQRRLMREHAEFPFNFCIGLLDHDMPTVRVGAAWILSQGKVSINAEFIRERLNSIKDHITCHADIRIMHIYQGMLAEEKSPTKMMMEHHAFAWARFKEKLFGPTASRKARR